MRIHCPVSLIFRLVCSDNEGACELPFEASFWWGIEVGHVWCSFSSAKYVAREYQLLFGFFGCFHMHLLRFSEKGNWQQIASSPRSLMLIWQILPPFIRSGTASPVDAFAGPTLPCGLVSTIGLAVFRQANTGGTCACNLLVISWVFCFAYNYVFPPYFSGIVLGHESLLSSLTVISCMVNGQS